MYADMKVKTSNSRFNLAIVEDSIHLFNLPLILTNR